MQLFIGTKLIHASPMTRAQYNRLRGWEVPSDENPTDEGFLVEYLDGGKGNVPGYKGYVSWSPKGVFERAYRPVNGLNFGEALEALRLGVRVARRGWNGKGMFVYLVPANSYPPATDVAREYFGGDRLVPYNAYFAIKNVDETVSTWVPSVNDVLAEDWEVLV